MAKEGNTPARIKKLWKVSIECTPIRDGVRADADERLVFAEVEEMTRLTCASNAKTNTVKES